MVGSKDFFSDAFFVGEQSLYPAVLEDLGEIFESGWFGFYLTGAIGTGKTVSCLLALQRMLYELLELGPDAASKLGLCRGSDIDVAVLTEGPPQFRRRLLSLLYERLMGARYFARAGIEVGMDCLRLPNGISVITSGIDSATALLGRNLYGAIVDAHGGRYTESLGSTITTLSNRIRSRFVVRDQCDQKLIVAGSSRMDIAMEAHHPHIRAISHSLWSTHPEAFSEETFVVAYSEKNQWVQIIDGSLKLTRHQMKDHKAILVPKDFRKEFTRDPVAALCDIGGISVTVKG